MKAVVFHEHGGPAVLKYEDAPDPKPGRGDVLIEVKATSINHIDIFPPRHAWCARAFAENRGLRCLRRDQGGRAGR